jgi:exopolysaccharide biosynthesis polyprenyl glycosylphosphotransferase
LDPAKAQEDEAPLGAGTAGTDTAHRLVESDPEAILAAFERRRRGRVTTRRGVLMRRALVAADVVGLMLAVLVTQTMVASQGATDAVSAAQEIGLFAATLPLWLLGAKLFGLYERDEERADHSTSDDLVRVFLLVTVGLFVTERLVALTSAGNPEDRRVVALWLLAIACVTGARITARTVARSRAAYRQRTLIVGAGHIGQLLARKLEHHPEFGLDLIGFVDTNPRERLPHVEHVPVLGELDDLLWLASGHAADRVIFAFTGDRQEKLLPLVRHLRDSGVQVDIVPRLFAVIGPKIDIHSAEGMSLVGLPPVKLTWSSRALKRALDFTLAGALLILAAPLMVLIAVAIRLDSKGPVLFRSRRLGQGMEEFDLLKFRTMRSGADPGPRASAVRSRSAAPGVDGLFKAPDLQAVTRVGRYLRRSSLDELPQLVNVLRGDMSLVGPRPCLAYELEYFESHHFERFLVPAGMTGYWQVSARAKSTFVEALDMDVLYAQSCSFGLDVRLLLRTPLQLLRLDRTA